MARFKVSERIKRFSRREKIVSIFVVLLITLSSAGYLYLPARREADRISDDARSLKMEIDLLETQIPDLKKRTDDLMQGDEGAEVAGEISRKIGDVLPGGDRLSVLLEEITRLARRRRVDFVSIRPEGIEDKGSYIELAMKIAIKSRYRELGEYLGMIEGLPRTIKIKDIKVESNAGINPQVMGQLDVVTYMGKK
ncbi:MAG: type 4a pilus biogenesis protein PilO [Nitrospirota bacterium]